MEAPTRGNVHTQLFVVATALLTNLGSWDLLQARSIFPSLFSSGKGACIEEGQRKKKEPARPPSLFSFDFLSWLSLFLLLLLLLAILSSDLVQLMGFLYSITDVLTQEMVFSKECRPGGPRLLAATSISFVVYGGGTTMGTSDLPFAPLLPLVAISFAPPHTPLVDKDGKVLTSPRARARAFLRLFREKHTSPLDERMTKRPPLSRLPALPVSLWEVRWVFRRLRRGGCPDEKGISPRLLFWLRPSLEPLLVSVFSKMEKLPSSWRDSTFIPLLKEQKPADLLASYRPVAITPLLCRVWERIIVERMAKCVPLHPRQFGFKVGSSPLHAVASLLDDALNGFTKKCAHKKVGGRDVRAQQKKTMVVLVDLSDAFSRVPTSLLLSHLSQLCPDAQLCAWVREWLLGRRGRVFLEGVTTKYTPLPSGVPQGSVLGPFLFSLYIDSLAQQLSERCVSGCREREGASASFCLYADDITLWASASAIEMARAVMMVLLRCVFDWARASAIPLSNKSQALLLTRCHRLGAALPLPLRLENWEIPFVKVARVLGFYLDPLLHWGEHIAHSLEWAGVFLRKLKRISHFVHPHHLRSLWACGVSRLLFGVPLWAKFATKNLLDKLESVHAAGCKLATCAVSTSRNLDALAEAGFRSLGEIGEERIVRTSLSGHGPVAPPPPPPPPPLVHPLLVSHTGLMEWMPGGIPHPLFDKLEIISAPPSGSANDPPLVRLLANQEQHTRVSGLLSPLEVVEIWTDGSVEGGKGGGAGVVFLPGGEEGEHLFGAPSSDVSCCSYTAEVSACLAGVELVEGFLRSLEPQRWKGVGISFCSDSLSWISHMANGPCAPGIVCPLLWSRFLSLCEKVGKIVISFRFAHCGDVRGDRVDELAGLARRSGPTPNMKCWPGDVAREQIEKLRREEDEKVKKDQGLRASCGAPPLSKIPLELPRSVAVDLARLRLGVWAKLGFAAICNEKRWCCPKCHSMVPSRADSVKHLFVCPAFPSPYLVEDLWKGDVKTLEGMVMFARNFAESAVVVSSPPPPPQAPHLECGSSQGSAP